MSIKPLLEKITKDWTIKAICFVLAIMIYFFHQISLLSSKTFFIPLEVRAAGNMLPVAGLEQARYIKVKIRTNRDKISSITEKDIIAFIDISSQTKEGDYEFPINIEFDEKFTDLELEPLEVYNKPSSLKIQIQKKGTKSIPLYTTIFGSPAYGYKALPVQISPEFVTLSGPQSMLDELNGLQVTSIAISKANSTVTKIVKPINTNSYISILDESEIKVTVPIVQEDLVKDFNDIEISILGLPSTLGISETPQKLNLTIEGTKLNIEKTKLTDLKIYADCSSITEPGIYEIPIQIEVPRGLKVSSQSQTVFTINVVNKEDLKSEEEIKESRSTTESTGLLLKSPIIS